MEMSAPKSKGMHVHTRERLPVSTEVEVEALDLPHSCPKCKRTFPTRLRLAVHQARWCRPGQRPASRRGQLADKAVKLAKRKAASTSGHGRRVARVCLPVRLPRVPLHQRRRRRSGHAPSHNHRWRAVA